MYKDFKEFDKNIRPYYGKANYTDNMQLFRFIEELEDEEET